MEYSTVANIRNWLLETQIYIEENIIRLPRKSSIRLLIIIGVYCLIRPYLLKWSGVKQTTDYEKAIDEDETEDSSAANESQDAPDASRGVSGTSGNEKEVTWGEKARQRQERPIQELVEGHEAASSGDAESDKEIEDFLRKVIT